MTTPIKRLREYFKTIDSKTNEEMSPMNRAANLYAMLDDLREIANDIMVSEVIEAANEHCLSRQTGANCHNCNLTEVCCSCACDWNLEQIKKMLDNA